MAAVMPVPSSNVLDLSPSQPLLAPDILKQRLTLLFNATHPVEAPPPPEPSWTTTQIVLYSVILPLGLLWLIQKVLAIALFQLFNCLAKCFTGYSIANALLPATLYRNESTAFLVGHTSDVSHRYIPVHMITPDGVHLDGMLACSPKNWEKYRQNPESVSQSKVMIAFNGNGYFYSNVVTSFTSLYQSHDSLDFDILFFDYRGVGKSGYKINEDGSREKALPTCSRDLILDGYTVIKTMHNLGYSTKNVFIEGFSLGGAISAEAAAVDPQLATVNVGNIHSLKTVAGVVHGIVYNCLEGCIGSCVAHVLAYLISCLASWLLRNNGWEFNVESAWPKIQGYRRIDSANQDSLMVKGIGQLVSSTTIGTLETFSEEAALTPGTISYTLEYDGSHNSFSAGDEQRLAYYTKIFTML